nr:CaiB/BaiF CoA-transferase family protein [uncultured Sandarakinorhabdus sp.]
MSGPLAGLLVVAVEQAVAAPFASSRLADAGARVIKIERPEGDFARRYDSLAKGQSAYFVWLNRGKQSICLDLASEADRALLTAMLAKADVFIQNLKPGSLERLGFPVAELRGRHPRLICCTITGFGSDGPFSHLKAYDLIVQGETGLCAITGTPDGPARVGVSVCDIAAGMTAHAAILQALYRRERTGEGAAIEVSLFDALADWMNVPYLHHALGGRDTARAGVNHPSLAPYGAFRCKDGQQIIFSVQNQAEWRRFCALFLGDADMADDPRFAANMDRLRHRAALEQRVQAAFDTLDAAAAMARLEASGIAYGRLNDVAGLAAHPHLRTIAVATEAGELHVIAPAALVDGACAAARQVPALDADGNSLRAEFGQPATTAAAAMPAMRPSVTAEPSPIAGK